LVIIQRYKIIANREIVSRGKSIFEFNFVIFR
jgi:hypothetical protein